MQAQAAISPLNFVRKLWKTPDYLPRPALQTSHNPALVPFRKLFSVPFAPSFALISLFLAGGSSGSHMQKMQPQRCLLPLTQRMDSAWTNAFPAHCNSNRNIRGPSCPPAPGIVGLPSEPASTSAAFKVVRFSVLPEVHPGHLRRIPGAVSCVPLRSTSVTGAESPFCTQLSNTRRKKR